MKRRLVKYTSAAGDDIAWIYDMVAGAADPVTASRYERRIRDFCDGLNTHRSAATFARTSGQGYELPGSSGA